MQETKFPFILKLNWKLSETCGLKIEHCFRSPLMEGIKIRKSIFLKIEINHTEKTKIKSTFGIQNLII